MRLTVLGVSAALFLAAGCKPKPEEIRREQETREQRFRETMRLHFNNLNLDAHSRKESLRRDQWMAQENPTLAPPTGMWVSTYTFDDQGFIVSGYPCRTCGVKLVLPVISVYKDPKEEPLDRERKPAVLAYLCKRCGHSPYIPHGPGDDLRKSPCAHCLGTEKAPKEPNLPKDFDELKKYFTGAGATVKDMFELVEKDIEKPFRANIRYVRRTWSYDARATVPISEAALAKAASQRAYIPSEGPSEGGGRLADYSRPGFHRADVVYVGETEYSFARGKLTKLKAEVEEAERPWKDLKAVK